MDAQAAVNDPNLQVKVKLSALWAGATLCYLYGDVIGLWSPGALQRMMDGNMGFIQASPPVLLGIAVTMSIPPMMVFLSVATSAAVSRWLNVIFGLVFSAVMLATMPSAWTYGFFFYVYLGVVEVLMTGLIVWYALRWRAPGTSADNKPGSRLAPG